MVASADQTYGDADDKQICSANISALGVGNNLSDKINGCTLPSTGQAAQWGARYLLAKVDPNDNQREENDDNNVALFGFTMGNQSAETADLYLTPGVVPTELTIGKNFRVGVTQHNEGVAASQISTLRAWYSVDNLLGDGDTPVCELSVNAVAAGSQAAATLTRCRLPDDAAVGPGTIFVVADDDNDVVESDEIDNVLELVVNVSDGQVADTDSAGPDDTGTPVEPNEPQDTGTPDAPYTGSGFGCQCSTGSVGGGLGGAWVALALVGLARRRR